MVICLLVSVLVALGSHTGLSLRSASSSALQTDLSLSEASSSVPLIDLSLNGASSSALLTGISLNETSFQLYLKTFLLTGHLPQHY